MKTRAGLKSPSRVRYPIAMGTTMDAKLPIKLKTPPVRPIRCLGDKSETKTQEINAIPAPKKASDIKKDNQGRIVRVICPDDAAPT